MSSAIAALDSCIQQVIAAFEPPPRQTVSEWADQNRRLSSEASAEPGPWRTDRAPYQRAILDALTPNSPYERVVMMAASQTGKCLATDTPLPTPEGRATMGAVRVRYPASAGTEGDPVALAIKRSATWWNRKVLLISTPTVKGASRIESWWLRSRWLEAGVRSL